MEFQSERKGIGGEGQRKCAKECLLVGVGGCGMVWGRRGRQVEVGLSLGDGEPDFRRTM